MAPLRVTVTGATGLIGARLTSLLVEEGAHVTVLSRDPERAARAFRDPPEAAAWDAREEAAPAAALEGRDAVVHLAGESIAQRWSARSREEILESRVAGTRNLLAGLRACEQRPRTIVCASGAGYYGHRGEEPLDEEAPPGDDFLARVCVAWEQEAERAGELEMRVARMRTGVVLSTDGGALPRMLPAFRLGLGGPVGDGRQYLSWIHLDDHVALLRAALDDERFSGAVNATAPEPVTNREFAHALGAALRRPALMRVPRFALRAVLGEMSETVTTGARVLPAKALMLGFRFRHPDIDHALHSLLTARG